MADILYNEISTGIDSMSSPKLKPEVLLVLKSLMRGDDDGVGKKIQPLIPIEFELEIDGTGGMFPGNSFHSSYLSQRYKEEALFQMVGVGHKIDSSGWTTSIKGQIRAKSINANKKTGPIITKQGAVGNLGGTINPNSLTGPATGQGSGVLTGDDLKLANAVKDLPKDSDGNVPYNVLVSSIDQGDYIKEGKPKFTVEYLRNEYELEPIKWPPNVDGLILGGAKRPLVSYPPIDGSNLPGVPYDGIMFQVGNSYWTIDGDPLQLDSNITDTITIPTFQVGGG